MKKLSLYVLVVLGLILLNSCDNKKSLPDCDGTNYPNCYCVRGFTGNAAQKWNKKQDCLKKGGIDDNKKPLTKFEASQYCAIKSGEFAKEVRKEVYKECMNDEGF